MHRAAEALSIAPQAAALQVRELEHELDAALLDRDPHGAILTPAGECLYGLVCPLLEKLGTLANHLEDPELASTPPRLYVVSEGGVTVRIFSRVLLRLYGEHPELGLQIRTGSHDEGLRRLLANEADLVFGAARRVADELVFLPLLSSRWAMLAPPGHPLAERKTVTLEELGPWSTIVPTPQFLSREPEGDETPYRHPALRRNPAVETDGWPAARAFVEAGIGITVADTLAIPKDPRVASVPLADRLPTRTYGLFHRRDRREPCVLRPFVEALRAEYPEASPEPGAGAEPARRPIDDQVDDEESHRIVAPATNAPRVDLLRRLRMFCFAVRHRSISRAAEQVLSNQPTASKWIRQLEMEFGAELFDRSPTGIAPTPAAERLYRFAMPLVRDLDRLPETFAERFQGRITGRLRIGAGQTSATALLPRYLERFLQACPGVEIEVKLGNGAERLEWLRNFEVDLVIGAGNFEQSEFERLPLVESEAVLITPEDHPLAGRASVDIAEAVVFPGILPPEDSYTNRMAHTVLRQRGLVINRALEVSGWNVIKRYVEAGVGISAIPDICIFDADRVWKIPIPGVFPPRSYSLFTRRDATPSLATERFLGLVDSGNSAGPGDSGNSGDSGFADGR